MTTQPGHDLRAQVKAALATARMSQAEAARQLDLSAKHMSHMLTGRATLTLDWADRILTLCGMTLAVAAIPDTGQAHPTQPRIPLDDLTSDALDALYDELERAQRSATLHVTAHRTATRRADAMEAEVVRLTAALKQQAAVPDRTTLPDLHQRIVDAVTTAWPDLRFVADDLGHLVLAARDQHIEQLEQQIAKLTAGTP
ncbi:helix-turn-helix domain-containing protein [Streptomyces sp. DT117]|uniref:helix-turn-helix domain-containing protein n=1 Tax=Streptomyces sp. DT117 TaxID=3393422 RepID=UPI003CF1C82D